MFGKLDSDILNIVLRQLSGTMYELSMACVCREFRDILQKIRTNQRICTSIRWILSSESTFKWVLDNYGCIPYPIEVSNMIAAQGNLSLLVRVENNNNKLWNEKTCAVAAENGHLHVLKWLRENGCPWDRDVTTFAASGGHTDVIYWARINGCKWSEDACTAASGGILYAKTNRYRISAYSNKVYKKTYDGGHLSTLIWLIENGCPVDYGRVLTAAIHNNQIHIIEWIRANELLNIKCFPFLLDEAAQGGHIDTFAYLLKHVGNTTSIYSEDSCSEYMPYLSAATRGYVDIMEYAYQQGIPLPSARWEHSICNIGAYYGHLAVVKWGRKNGVSWGKTTCSQAAAGGNLDILIWLHENGCPWDESTCWQCARHGYLHIIKWARGNGCPWDCCTMSCACEKGDMKMIKWLYDNGCPWNEKACYYATSSGKLEVLIWLREKGCPWDGATLQAALRQERYLNRQDILKWVKDNGCPEL